ncbi:MAG: phospho-sugar mutase [Cyclobacteriaceae bacterium]|jgi:phosphoglucomutase|nr:phospho-sugar mutase [Cyclobacteriaceae bacterium]
MKTLHQQATERARQWLASPLDDTTRQDIQRLLAQPDPKELIDRFYKELEFGTGGLRGVMGTGSNCMNRYTVGMATQGLANYLVKSFPNQKVTVAIAHDSRNHSRTFAQITADVFSANGISVFLFPDLRPTPLLSFAIRYLGCQSGVVITASHNPKEYNGYKAYWNDGAQLVPPHDKNVMAEVNAIDGIGAIRFEANASLITSIGRAVEEAYYREVLARIPQKEAIVRQADVPLVYSSLHGAGITMVPECLTRMGFSNIIVVDEQREPDGNFPTVESPNPEEPSAMQMAMQKAEQTQADLVMATDPDTDRVGIGIRGPQGYFLLNGNQAFSLMMWFILKNNRQPNSYIAKTIVTSELVDDMARDLKITCFNTLTGFKYIAELMNQMEGKAHFIAAGEESYGYMVGDFIRDKDAVSACAFFAAMAAAAKDAGQSLYDWLVQMYVDHGFYKERLINLVRKGAEGEQQIKAMMQRFREKPPAELGGKAVVRMLDYKTRLDRHLISGQEVPILLPASDVIQFYLADGSKISVRPSGTEPKIKFYLSVKTRIRSAGEFADAENRLEANLGAIEEALFSL